MNEWGHGVEEGSGLVGRLLNGGQFGEGNGR